MGLCGGYQMPGKSVEDPKGIEGPAGSTEGPGWLDTKTVLTQQKRLATVQGRFVQGGANLRAYEIHCGVTEGADRSRAWLCEPEGAASPDGSVRCIYLHGLLDESEALSAVLAWAGLNDAVAVDLESAVQASLDKVADACEQHLDWEQLSRWLPSS